jgi:hypothetical protein
VYPTAIAAYDCYEEWVVEEVGDCVLTIVLPLAV